MPKTKATHEHARSTKGWARAAPQTVTEKRSLANRCGLRAFLKPNSKKPGYSSYPIMSKGSRICKPDCRGLRAAHSRAKQYGKRKLVRKAFSLAKRSGCDWTDE